MMGLPTLAGAWNDQSLLGNDAMGCLQIGLVNKKPRAFAGCSGYIGRLPFLLPVIAGLLGYNAVLVGSALALFVDNFLVAALATVVAASMSALLAVLLSAAV